MPALAAPPALALPEGRHYEMVSPPYKGGYGVRAGFLHVDRGGEGAAFLSQGAFAGLPASNFVNWYFAHRDASGWSTASVEVPAPTGIVSFFALAAQTRFSPTLQTVLTAVQLGPNSGSVLGGTEGEDAFFEHETGTPDTPSNWHVAGKVLELVNHRVFSLAYDGGSADFCHIVFRPTEFGGLFLGAPVRVQVYELQSGCGGEPSLRLVGVNNHGKPINPACEDFVGGGAGGRENGRMMNGVAAEGREIFFTQSVNVGAGEAGCARLDRELPHQLFVRLDGARTLEVSKPVAQACVEVPCEGAVSRPSSRFWGASEDGSRVFFTSAAPLTEEGDATSNLYLASIGCPGGGEGCETSQKQVVSLVRASRAAHSGEPAEVQGVVSVAPDGSRVYFVARGVLSEGANAEGRAPVKGADNLYAYDTATGGPPAFITALCSGPVRSGLVETARCPTDLKEDAGVNDIPLWSADHPEAQTSGPPGDEGRYFLFSTYASVLPSDTDNAKDVYRYDAVAGVLDRVSAGEDGSLQDGNCNDVVAALGQACDATLQAFTDAPSEADRSRAISSDGSRVVFMTAAALSPKAGNGRLNVYEWHKEAGWSVGKVALVSSGNALTSDGEPIITASGRDIFFTSSAGLVPADTDGRADVYDARLGGGFPAEPAPRQPCSGDACQGPLTNPAPLLTPGSLVQASGDNFAASAPGAAVSVKKPAKHKRRHKRRRSRSRSGRR
ncbi:MAG TPA: hypothetical protein VNY27_09565 [Solirubrobacteraceae bacterium]|nr:hypothetical protein [Solirubrobacteraceae bacterium]